MSTQHAPCWGFHGTTASFRRARSSFRSVVESSVSPASPVLISQGGRAMSDAIHRTTIRCARHVVCRRILPRDRVPPQGEESFSSAVESSVSQPSPLEAGRRNLFFTVVSHNRRPWFDDPKCRRWLRDSFRDTRRRFSFTLDAVVLLPDHLHVLIHPTEGVDYSAIWRLIQTEFTRRLLSHGTTPGVVRLSRRVGERSVWQRRFFEHVI